jgi:hypothetical protein
MEHSKPTPLRKPDPELADQMRTKMMLRREELAARDGMRPQIQADGIEALKRLLPIARGDTGQSGVIARFLLNLYNGNRFPFDMTDFRRLDYELFDDCVAVLKMDFQPRQEVHAYFTNGSAIWEQMAKDWNIKDFQGVDWRITDERE